MSKEKPTHGDLVKIEKHPHYYMNPISGKITWRGRIKGRAEKIATGETDIRQAKRVVEDRLLELLSDAPNKDRRERMGVSNHTIRAIWSDLMEEKRPQSEESTMRGYDVSWRISIEPFWGDLSASDINPNMVKKFENWYLRKFPNRVFFNTWKHISMLFNYAARVGYVARAPKVTNLDEVIRTKTKKKSAVGRVYTDEEIQRMLKEASARTRLGILFGRYMGLRKAEFLSIPWKNVDFKKGEVEVWRKNKYWHKIPLPAVLIEALKEYRKTHPNDDWVFQSILKPNEHITGQVFDKDWTETKRRAEIENWDVKNAARVHDLRHTFATQTARDGWPPTVACTMLDMSLKEYMKTYVHIVENDVKSWVTKSFGGSK